MERNSNTNKNKSKSKHPPLAKTPQNQKNPTNQATKPKWKLKIPKHIRTSRIKITAVILIPGLRFTINFLFWKKSHLTEKNSVNMNLIAPICFHLNVVVFVHRGCAAWREMPDKKPYPVTVVDWKTDLPSLSRAWAGGVWASCCPMRAQNDSMQKK